METQDQPISSDKIKQTTQTLTYKVKVYPSLQEEQRLLLFWRDLRTCWNLFIEQKIRAENQGILLDADALISRRQARIEEGKDYIDPLGKAPKYPPLVEGKFKAITKLSGYDQQKYIKFLRPLLGWDKWPATSFYEIPKQIEAAYRSYFALKRNAKLGAGNKDAQPPSYKSKKVSPCIPLLVGDSLKFKDKGYIEVRGVGIMKATLDKSLPSWASLALNGGWSVKLAQYAELTQDKAGEWWLHLIFKNVPCGAPLTGKFVGVDLGITHLATYADSDGQHGFYENMRPFEKLVHKIAEVDRGLDRILRTYLREKGLPVTSPNRKNYTNKAWASKNAQKLRKEKNKLLRRVVAQRRLVIGTITKRLIEAYDVIAIEDLNVAAMVKSNLSKQITDTTWGLFRTELERKAKASGKEVIVVNPRNTSRTCHACGHVAKENRIGERFVCQKCDHKDHADVNAARNILRLALTGSLEPAVMG